MTEPSDADFRVVGSETLVDAGFLQLARLHVESADGDEFDRHVVRHPGAVVVVPVQTDPDGTRHALLVRQWRVATDQVLLEVPAGKRDGLIEAGRRAGLELRPFFHPLSDMPPYRAYGSDCPASRALSETGLNLPTSSAVDATVVARMRAVFQEALA